MDLLPITVAEMLAEVRRELRLRASVYPRQVATGRLKQDKADRQIAILEALARKLEAEV